MNELLIIDGKRLPAASEETTSIINPATGEPMADVPAAGTEDIERAILAAHTSFSSGAWRRMKPRERGRRLTAFSELLRSKASELAELETKNTGKPIRESRDEVGLAADCFQYYAGAVDKIGGETHPVSANGIAMTFRDPIGACALIVPWNFPIAITAWKLAPAIAMGNSVVIKPSVQTPLTALRLGQLALEADIPAGVVNIVTGRGSVLGESLVRHPLVRKVSFTGSTEVGRQVMKWSADGMKRLTLELGGKSANLVFADADMERALEAAVWSVLGNAGQDCCARSRLLVEIEAYEPFLSNLERRFKNLKQGDPLKEETEIGSLISVSHRDRVLAYIEEGKNEGASLVCGGDIPDEAGLARGAYLTPAIFSDVSPAMTIARDEIFGPVVAVIPFETEEQAIALANDSDYGLSGSVWSKDGGRGLRVARQLEAGVISVNSSQSVHLEAPFGGMKSSGFGKELGMTALEHYSEVKSIFISTE
jgi:betaine-aldehyde dehydrogenase